MKRIAMWGVLLSAVTVIGGCYEEQEDARVTALTNANCYLDYETGQCVCVGSPVVLDLAGDGIHLTGPNDPVQFSLRAGHPWIWSWTAAGSDDAWLVLDANRNGKIDDGSEMFGDGTLQAISSSQYSRSVWQPIPVHGHCVS